MFGEQESRCASVLKHPWSSIRHGRYECWNGDNDAAIRTLMNSGEDWYSALRDINGSPGLVPGAEGVRYHGVKLSLAEPTSSPFSLVAPFKERSPIVGEGDKFDLYGIWSPPLIPGGASEYDVLINYKGPLGAFWYQQGNSVSSVPLPYYDNIPAASIKIEAGKFDHVFLVFKEGGPGLPVGDYRLTAKVQQRDPALKVHEFAPDADLFETAFAIERWLSDGKHELARSNGGLEVWEIPQIFRLHSFRFKVVPPGEVQKETVAMVQAYLAKRW